MSTTIERQISGRLAERRVRYTTGRRTVVTALSRADGPRSASELHESLAGAVPLSSLYRSLAVLEDAGVVTPHHGTRGVTRYELAEWLAGHHHHLICIECGSVDDITLSTGAEGTLERLVAEITAGCDFTAEGHSLEIEGRCTGCA